MACSRNSFSSGSRWTGWGNARTEQPERVRILEETLDRLLSWIGAVDSRIQTTLAVAIAMLGVIAAKAPTPSLWWSGAGSFFLLSFGVLLVSASMTIFAVFPRLSGHHDSLIYFGSVAGLPEGTFAERSRNMTVESYLADLEHQCYRNAQIAAHKFAWVQRSMIALIFAVPTWLVAVYLLYGGVA